MDANFEAFITQYWWVLLIVLAWTLPWKAVALWKAARRGERGWFVALFLINTFALLEIYYIFMIAKQESKDEV